MRTDQQGAHLTISDLVERIEHYAKIRLCERPDGIADPREDYLLAERDRYLICRALRAQVSKPNTEGSDSRIRGTLTPGGGEFGRGARRRSQSSPAPARRATDTRAAGWRRAAS